MKCSNCHQIIIEKYKGHSFCSKLCYSIYLKNWRKNNQNYHRDWKKQNPDYMREWWINHKGYLRKWWLENDYDHKFIQKKIAQKLAYQYIKIPEEYKCEICEIFLATQRHHEDYSKPFEVILCCKSCHGELDRLRHKSEELKCEN